MAADVQHGLLISDFNIRNLAGFLNNSPAEPPVKAVAAPFGQVVQLFSDQQHEIWQKHYEFIVAWTTPEGAAPLFRNVLNYEQVDEQALLAQVDEYSELLLRAADKAPVILVPAWVMPHDHRGWGLLDHHPQLGMTALLAQMNRRLAQNLGKQPGYYVMDTQRWTARAGVNAFNPKLYYMAKIVFDNPVFKSAAEEIKSALRAVSGGSRKLVIVDLDDTLWGGIVGDLGWENIRLGGHDPIGEAFVDFQRTLKSLTRRGIILGIVSKNEEKIALEAIEKHPEMALGKDDFAGWRINWQDKAQNIIDLVDEINLGLQSVVFIDDNPAERARVRDALPEVLVPEWPKDKMLYKQALLQLDCFDTASVSKEDSERSRMYVSERKRKDLQKAGSVDDWLHTLQMKVEVSLLNDVDLPRTAQLLNKTNQMNLSTRRLPEAELKKWAGEKGRRLWNFRVSDRFGESGLTGILSMEWDNSSARIVDFILSCRVMGRQVEETMLHVAVSHAQSVGAGKLVAGYLPTAKNNPCLRFFKNSGMQNHNNTEFTWDTGKDYDCPAHIELIDKTGPEHD